MAEYTNPDVLVETDWLEQNLNDPNIRVIEGLSIQRFGGMEIHVWRPLDSKFRLITARRNPNMVILAGSLLFRRPDTGLVLVAWWTLISLIFHAVRLAQMTEQQARGATIASWLDK